MAASKYYAYYIRGGQFALVEYDSISADGQTLDQPGLNDIGPGGGLSWKSPISTVSNGLEIEYSYSPRYILPNTISTTVIGDRTQFYLNGWINHDGYLTLVVSGYNWELFTKLVVGGYIVIRGSARWNGVHRIQEIQSCGAVSHGGVKTYTRVTDESPATIDLVGATWNATNTAVSHIGALTTLHFSQTTDPYIWLSGSEAGVQDQNGGMFSGWSLDAFGTVLSLNPTTTGLRYEYTDNLTVENTATPDFVDDTSAFYMYKANHEPSMYMIAGVDVLSDEADTIDLPEYLAKALVYYVKAKMAEDMADIDQKEYFLKEFRGMLEKHESSKVWGARVLGPGPSAIR